MSGKLINCQVLRSPGLPSLAQDQRPPIQPIRFDLQPDPATGDLRILVVANTVEESPIVGQHKLHTIELCEVGRITVEEMNRRFAEAVKGAKTA